jgi:hypothetical protein
VGGSPAADAGAAAGDQGGLRLSAWLRGWLGQANQQQAAPHLDLGVLRLHLQVLPEVDMLQHGLLLLPLLHDQRLLVALRLQGRAAGRLLLGRLLAVRGRGALGAREHLLVAELALRLLVPLLGLLLLLPLLGLILGDLEPVVAVVDCGRARGRRELVARQSEEGRSARSDALAALSES